MSKYAELSKIVSDALSLGHEAAAKSDDGGTANLDSIVLTGLKGVREKSLINAGIPCSKKRSENGAFWLNVSFGGQGNKRNAGVEAAKKYLQENGVRCYIYYQMD